MNGKAKGWSDGFIYDTDERRSGITLGRTEQSSLMFAYVRLCSLNRRKNNEETSLIFRVAGSGRAAGCAADCKTRGLTLPRASKRGFVASKSGEIRRVDGTARGRAICWKWLANPVRCSLNDDPDETNRKPARFANGRHVLRPFATARQPQQRWAWADLRLMNQRVEPLRHFASDNYAGICPEAWAALTEANQGHAVGYGDDA